MLAAVAEDLGNRFLRLDPDTLKRLGDLHGRVFCLEFADGAHRFYLQPSEGGLRILDTWDGAVDATLRGRPLSFAKLALGATDPAQFFAREVTVAGDVELGRRLAHILAALDIDWEERAAGVVGDVAAHKLGNLARGFSGWARQAADTLARDFAEYMQEENRTLAPRAVVDAFLRDVDGLRADADRLAARIERLRAAFAATRPG